MKLRMSRPKFTDLPRAGERIRLSDGRLARVTKIATRWEADEDERGRHSPIRLLRAELDLVPDAKPKA